MPYKSRLGFEDILAWFDTAPLRIAKMALLCATEALEERQTAKDEGKADPAAVFATGMQPAPVALRRRRTKAEIAADEVAARVPAPKPVPVEVIIPAAPDPVKRDPQGRDRQLPLTAVQAPQADLGPVKNVQTGETEGNPFAS